MTTERPKLNIRASKHFRDFWKNKHSRYLLLYGGRGGGKTFSATQKIVTQLLSRDYHRIVLVRYYHAQIRNSIWKEVLDRVKEYNLESIIKVNEGGMTMYGPYGNELICAGVRQSGGGKTDKLKGLAGFTDVYIDEADAVPELDFDRLDDSIRATRINGRNVKPQVCLIFNTEDIDSWIANRWFRNGQPSDSSGRTYYNLSTYKNNKKYLDPDIIWKYESYKETNPEFYKVYVLGQWGKGKLGKIFPHWRHIDTIPPEALIKPSFGLDFGYSNDPSALVGSYELGNTLYLDELFYQIEASNRTLVKAIKSGAGSARVFADHDPRTINELNTLGANVSKALKGPGSIEAGIAHFNSYDAVYLTTRSVNAWNEQKYYVYAVDNNGKTLNVPDKLCEDHFMDAARYSRSYKYAGLGGGTSARGTRTSKRRGR